jgi:hypothetical protein
MNKPSSYAALCAVSRSGGSRNHVWLQPLSIQGKTGLNVAAGITG